MVLRRAMLSGGAAALAGAGLLSASKAHAHTQPTGRLFNVRAFGAVGDGVADDTAAVIAAINAVWRGRPEDAGVVYFPPGNYRCTRQLLFVGGNCPSVTLLGDGRGASRITFTTPQAGFDFQFSNADRTFRCAGLSLTTNVMNGGTALAVSWKGDTGPYSHAHIEDVEIGSETYGNPDGSIPLQCWDYGIRLTRAHRSLIRGVWFRGRANNVTAVCAFELIETFNTVISGCHTNFSNIAFHIAASGGVIIRDSYMVHHNVGVLARSGNPNGSPLMEVSSCHILALSRGIQMQNHNQATLSHNVIYGAANGAVAIECQDNCADSCIHNNRFALTPGVSVGVGIVHSGRRSQINYNIGGMNPLVDLRGNSNRCTVMGNSGGPILDQVVGSGNVITLNNP